MTADCPLCRDEGGAVVAHRGKYRVIRAREEGFPAFYRVVWNGHSPELSDLPDQDRNLCMAAVVAVERALREWLQPDKVNVAALGNMVPHLHWHVIARFAWDTHFPAPVWSQAQRPADPARLAEVEALLPAVERTIAATAP